MDSLLIRIDTVDRGRIYILLLCVVRAAFACNINGALVDIPVQLVNGRG
jgi:hypothetical protein